MMRLQNLGYFNQNPNPIGPYTSYDNAYSNPDLIQPGQEAFPLPMTPTPSMLIPGLSQTPIEPSADIPFNFFNRADRLQRRAERDMPIDPSMEGYSDYADIPFNFFNRADRLQRRADDQMTMNSGMDGMYTSQDAASLPQIPRYTSLDQLKQDYQTGSDKNIETYYYKEFDRLTEIDSIDKDFKSGKITQAERDSKVNEINQKYVDTMPTVSAQQAETPTVSEETPEDAYKKYLDLMMYSRLGTAGLSIPETAFLTGKYLGLAPGTKGKWLGAGLGFADLALKGAREVLSGIGYQKANEEAKRWYAEQMNKRRYEPVSETRTGYTGDIATAAEGGTFNNPGFNALPQNVQDKIMQDYQNKKYAEGGGPGDKLREFGKDLKRNAFFSVYPYEYNAFDTSNVRNDLLSSEYGTSTDTMYTPQSKFGLGYEKYLEPNKSLGISQSVGLNLGLPYSGDFNPTVEGFYSTKFIPRGGENSGIPKIKSTLSSGYSPEEGANAGLNIMPYWEFFKNSVGRDKQGIPFQKGYDKSFLRGYAGPTFEAGASGKAVNGRTLLTPSFNYGLQAGFRAKPFKKSDLQLTGDFGLLFNPAGKKGGEYANEEVAGRIQGSIIPTAKLGITYPLTNLPRVSRSYENYMDSMGRNDVNPNITQSTNTQSTQSINTPTSTVRSMVESTGPIQQRPLGPGYNPITGSTIRSAAQSEALYTEPDYFNGPFTENSVYNLYNNPNTQEFKAGGQFNNPGFNALPVNVQNRIIQGHQGRKYAEGGEMPPLVEDANSYLDLFSFLTQGQMPTDYSAMAPMDMGLQQSDFATDPMYQPGEYIEFEYGGKMHKGIIKSNNGKTISLK